MTEFWVNCLFNIVVSWGQLLYCMWSASKLTVQKKWNCISFIQFFLAFGTNNGTINGRKPLFGSGIVLITIYGWGLMRHSSLLLLTDSVPTFLWNFALINIISGDWNPYLIFKAKKPKTKQNKKNMMGLPCYHHCNTVLAKYFLIWDSNQTGFHNFLERKRVWEKKGEQRASECVDYGSI